MPVDQSIFFFGNSLVNFAEGGAQTNVPFWMNRFAEFEDNSLSVNGGYGFLRQFADRQEPDANWGFQGVSTVYDGEQSSFAENDFSSIVITPANFIQDRTPRQSYEDGDSSPLDATRDIVQGLQETQPDARIYIYEGWADMAPFAPDFPPSEPQLDDYHAYNAGEYHNWYETLADQVSAQTGSEVTLIPVASVLSDLLTSYPLNQIDTDQLYVDSAPHGTETLYFLSGLITYGAIYGTMPPPDYAVPGSVDPTISVNFSQVTEQISNALGDRGFEVALSDGFGEFEDFGFIDLGEDAFEPPAQEPEDTNDRATDNDNWIAPIEVEPGYDTAEDGAEPATDDSATAEPIDDGDGWIAPVEVEPGYDTDGDADVQPAAAAFAVPETELPDGEPQLITRTIEAPTDGPYTFDLTSDDTAALYIDGQLIMVNDGQDTSTAQQAIVDLTEGPHAVEIAFYEQDGGEVLILDFGPTGAEDMPFPQGEFEDIPEEDEGFDDFAF